VPDVHATPAAALNPAAPAGCGSAESDPADTRPTRTPRSTPDSFTSLIDERMKMASFIKNLTFDCENALRVARFWAAALVSDVDEESTEERAYVEAPGWGGPNIWFRGGRRPKAAPNHLHLDLRALTSMSKEVERLIALGATVVQRYDDITVMQDPEGNEFCVEPGPDDPHGASGR
jgi:Glyoxalase-like domain